MSRTVPRSASGRCDGMFSGSAQLHTPLLICNTSAETRELPKMSDRGRMYCFVQIVARESAAQNPGKLDTPSVRRNCPADAHRRSWQATGTRSVSSMKTSHFLYKLAKLVEKWVIPYRMVYKSNIGLNVAISTRTI